MDVVDFSYGRVWVDQLGERASVWGISPTASRSPLPSELPQIVRTAQKAPWWVGYLIIKQRTDIAFRVVSVLF